MRPLRFLAVVAYIGYLVNVGLLLVLLPWSRAWGRLMASLYPELAWSLDQPWVRGLIAAFGVLHLLLVSWELVHPTLVVTGPTPRPGSRNLPPS